MPLKAGIVARIADVAADEWDALDPTGHPFTRHAFLEALEATGCVGEHTGWIPAHLVVHTGGRGRRRLVAAVPQYLKTHSWGEFVFDWNWARSYQHAGLEYYPKQLAAVPFTPVTGPRLLFDAEAAGLEPTELRDELASLLLRTALRTGASGAHVNFTREDDQAALERAGFLRRHDCRFLWRNRGYRSFDEFLAGFRADKRKKARRERRRVAEAGIVFRTLAGEAIDVALWRTVFGFSERTFLRHGNEHYLNVEFLRRVSHALPGTVMVKLAERAGTPVGAAIFVEGGGGLYGRYWGAAGHEDSLHFEACYYQGIEYCIERGLEYFDPGTQGEHKIARGFEPTCTTSAHWLAHDGFRAAIGRYLEREREAIDAYIVSASAHLPFQRGPSGADRPEAGTDAGRLPPESHGSDTA